MAIDDRQLDTIVKDKEGFVRLGSVVLFRIIYTAAGPLVHIRIKSNCKQVQERGSPDYFISWEDFKAEVEGGDGNGA